MPPPREILKTLIRKVAQLGYAHTFVIILSFVSFFILLGCVADDHWLMGDDGRQGLWRHCTTINSTSTCCGSLDDVLGYKNFIGATRGFSIIELILHLPMLYYVYQVYSDRRNVELPFSLAFVWGICTLIILAVYGGKHKDISGGLSLGYSFWFCLVNLILQIIIAVLSLTLF